MPSDAERQLRALWFTAIDDNPLVDLENPESITAAQVAQITGDSRVHKWWSKPGFRGWFLNKVQVQAKAEYALDLLLDSLVDLAQDPDPKSYPSKVSAAKFLADMRGYTGRSKAAPAPDADIPTDRAQLEAFVRNLTKKLESAD